MPHNHKISVEAPVRADCRAIEGHACLGVKNLRVLVATLNRHVQEEKKPELLLDDPGIRLMVHSIASLVGVNHPTYTTEDFQRDCQICEDIADQKGIKND